MTVSLCLTHFQRGLLCQLVVTDAKHPLLMWFKIGFLIGDEFRRGERRGSFCDYPNNSIHVR